MAELTVHSPEGKYNIIIQNDLLQNCREYLPEFSRAVIVSNQDIAEHANILSQYLQCPIVFVPEGEQHKNLQTVSWLYSEFTKINLDRSSVVIALGGGVIGDMAGFAAATYMRGINLVQFPTSLLAMVDSSVGGKVGVDLPEGKNLVGAFKQPKIVLIDPEVLKTLPEQQWRCGMAEVIKHGLLQDPDLLEADWNNKGQLENLLAQAIQVKINFVEKDPYERNERMKLNLGHTFAHAIEQVSQYRWPHGEAVAVGLLAAAQLSQKLQICDESLPQRIKAILEKQQLPTSIDFAASESLYQAMHLDKKKTGKRLRFILLRDIADPVIYEDAPKDQVISVLQSISEGK